MFGASACGGDDVDPKDVDCDDVECLMSGSSSGGTGGAGGEDGGTEEIPDYAKTPADVCGGTGRVYGVVVSGGALAAEDTDYVGINLDGIVSTGGDLESCGKVDKVDPTYGEGIDNQFSNILDAVSDIPDLGLSNITTIVSNAFQNGQLLIVMRIEGVDDLVNDDCVNVVVGEGSGRPLFADEVREINGEMGTVAVHVPYQTFGFDDTEAPISRMQGKIVNGELILGPDDVALPVSALDARFILPIQLGQGRLSIEKDPDGPGVLVRGMLGGGMTVDALVEIVSDLNIDKTLLNLVEAVGTSFTDLAPDENGECQLISAGIHFETRPAYVDPALTTTAEPEEEGGW